MTTTEPDPWPAANQGYLTARLAIVHARLARLGAPDEAADETAGDGGSRIDALEQRARAIADAMERPPVLDQVCRGFSLSAFERDVLVMCAAMELDPELPELCAAAQQNPRLAYPTFNLVLTALPGAHWSALTPVGPLRRWRLIDGAMTDKLMTGALRIDERVLHHLVGDSYLDERLQQIVEPVAVPSRLPGSYAVHAERIVELWSGTEGDCPVVHLGGAAGGGKRMLAAVACAALGLRLHALRAADLPGAPGDRETLTRLWQRESILSHSALLLDCDESLDPAALRTAERFVERVEGLLFVTGGERLGTTSVSTVRLDVDRPAPHEQRALWEGALGARAEGLNGHLDSLVAQFQLDVEAIAAAGRAVSEMSPAAPEDTAAALWEACRGQARTSLDHLAERIPARASWEHLVLPDEQHQTLREIIAHARQRTKVYESWGFAGQGGRGLGISALFTGPSGTGKTLAAEVVAGELRLDLYRIDLSQVVSKYIGETEKSLRRVFDAAEHSGAVLLFDEADALFGKRSEVRDSHDRYANIEISYLLQRMESYRGLAILTTNRRGALDTAFLRRLRFVVAFPFPDATQRARIWERIFPAETPTEGLDVHKLARLNVAGGNIRNIALNAAFLAADEGRPVRMSHLLRTARSECAKLEKSATTAEVGTWV